jgi:parallel beta-helix repeat protein
VFIRNLVTASVGNKIIDGSAARITVEIPDDPASGVSVFNVLKSARDLTFRNLRFDIKYTGGASGGTVYGIKSNAYRLAVKDGKMDFTANNQINYTAIYNDGTIDTHMDTPADNLSVSGNHISARCAAAEHHKESVFCGIDNVLANSASISNNYLFIQNAGNGEGQKAIGIRNSGRFARIENNNIKANGSHNIGKELEKAYACGVYNTGLYMVFTGNNCVGEWGGKCIGLYNAGGYANITGNKILATHTIMGRTVVMEAEHCILADNVITNTSRNPHFVEVLMGSNIISNNYMQGLMGAADYRSGCGIWVVGTSEEKVSRCNIANNIISCARDFGIALINTEKNNISGNQFIKFAEVEDYAAVYAENSADTVKDNICDGLQTAGQNNMRDKMLRNRDEAVYSLYE